MKTFYVVASFAIMLMLGVANAHANDSGDRSDRGKWADVQQRHDSRSEQRQQERIAVDRRVESDSRRLSVERMTEQNRHANHLSAEERRALRQQINEAGQDIYNRHR